MKLLIIPSMLFIILFSVFGCVADSSPKLPLNRISQKKAVPNNVKRIDELFVKLSDSDSEIRKAAAEDLGEIQNDTIASRLRNVLEKESDFCVKLSINFAMAMHGQKDGIRILIDSLRQKVHFGYIYLRKATGQDFDWNISMWEKWYEATTEKEFKEYAESRFIDRPKMEAWSEFRSLYRRKYFSDLHKEDKFDENKLKKLEEMPNAKAWCLFDDAVRNFQNIGNRKKAQKQFEKISKVFSQTYYAEDSEELAGLFKVMIVEDKSWKEPLDVQKLNTNARISYYVYHLRNVVAYQYDQPGYCNVLNDFGQLNENSSKNPKEFNAAVELANIGEESIPCLIELLEDRRPIRAVGYWRNYVPEKTVLRYQDAAIQILNQIMPYAVYERASTSAYFSTENSITKISIKKSIQSWYLKSKGKSEVEKKWLAVNENPGIYQLLGLLKELAFKHGEKEKVLKILREEAKNRDAIQLPQVSYLLCQLGDESYVSQVVKAYINGDYHNGGQLPDDSDAGSNAEEYALEQWLLYGNNDERMLLKEYFETNALNKRKTYSEKLIDLAKGNWRGIPETYDVDRFPVEYLVSLLDFKNIYSSSSQGVEKWETRYCDAAVQAIEKITKNNFEYNEKSSFIEKDAVVQKVREWWVIQIKNK